jgi:putative Mg2+ transporter-C (MgtC) family protein
MEIERLVSILVAMLLGGLVGLEREIAGKPAGLRTNMLVAGASAFIVKLSDLLVERFVADVGQTALIRVDSLRVIEAVVTGVSFIGAGTIIRRSEDLEVEGLTTAATLLFTAALGMAVALGAPWLALGAALAVVVTLRVVAKVEKRIPRKRV